MGDNLKKVKKIRDPIYGYIQIDEDIVHNVIDTATFQRLRNIRQTSYAPLYPSSLHNRFVHSLGVYYLGCIAFNALYESLKKHASCKTKVLGELEDLLGKETIERYGYIFHLACLLHDVGHSPFSHTGEKFYLSCSSAAWQLSDEKEQRWKRIIDEEKDVNKKRSLIEDYEEEKKYDIFKHLAYLTNDSVFDASIVQSVAPHEVMSCIVALEAFGKDNAYFKNDEEKAFFARCITGIQYSEALNLDINKHTSMSDSKRDEVRKKMFLNCIIQLLNSSVIDVDRLDYIIRDASTMGYQSVSIDYKRLLSGFELILTDEYNFIVGFHKNAISIIENAVYAHDNEKKWVQNHPAILYEGFILQQAIMHIESKMKSAYVEPAASLFSFESLTDQGSRFVQKVKSINNSEIVKDGRKEENALEALSIRYLGDADLIFLMKSFFPSVYSEEFFSRNKRRLPVWKSEAEFMNLFDAGEGKTILNVMGRILLDNNTRDDLEINISLVESIEKENIAAQAKELSNKISNNLKKLKYINKIFELCKKYNIKENVLLLSKDFFKSNFSKDAMRKLPILFPGYRKTPKKLEEVSTTLFSNQVGEGKLIYFFYYPKKDREKINIYAFSRELLRAFKEIEETL